MTEKSAFMSSVLFLLPSFYLERSRKVVFRLPSFLFLLFTLSEVERLSSVCRLPSSVFLRTEIRYIRYIRYRIRCRTSFAITVFNLKSQIHFSRFSLGKHLFVGHFLPVNIPNFPVELLVIGTSLDNYRHRYGVPQN